MTASAGHSSQPGAIPMSAARTTMPGTLVRPGTQQESVTAPAESPTQLALRRLRENRIGMIALAGFLLICSLSFTAPWFETHWAGRSATDQNLAGTEQIGGKRVEVVDIKGMPAIGPGLRKHYTFGADALGRDVFVRALAGGSVSLRVGFGATFICILLGTTVGLLGGFYGGATDKVLAYVVDVMIAFPFMLFAIALSAATAASGKLGPIPSTSILIPMLLLGLGGAWGFSRVIRANAKEMQAKEFVEAARALGADDGRIMLRHVLPHMVPTIITYFGILLAGMILGEAGLSFLGIGVQAPTPSWGNLIADGQAFYSTAWWIAGAGGLFVMLTVLCVNLLGEAVEEAFDPKAGR
ncbi:MAG: binding-protein-dependent transport system inner rane component [Thermoleophilia bacterium]|nr:binding-protein-dependent transport system inner rane component [Thermoleophilia bacterium]